MIQPDTTLPWSAESIAAWHRITGKLERSGEWDELFRSGCFVAATQCASYIACVRIDGPRAPVIEQRRVTARLWLVDMGYLSSATSPQLDDAFRDIDLFELCMPLEDAAA